jgi:hypothetical protein
MPSSLLMPAPPLDDAVIRRALVAGVAAAGLISCSGEPRIGSGQAPAAGLFPDPAVTPATRAAARPVPRQDGLGHFAALLDVL